MRRLVIVLLIGAFLTPVTAFAATTPRDYGTGRPGPLANVVLARLAVKGNAPLTGYARAAFGIAWDDLDRNGCDQRDDALWRASFASAQRRGTCTVVRAVVVDVYTGRTISFVRGGDVRHELDIDHVVALANAWKSGAWASSTSLRHRLANDPLNLLAVDPTANRQKGDANAASWLPPRRAYRCAYVARQIAVKSKYGLSVTPSERDAMRRVLAYCPGQRIPVGGLAAPSIAQRRPVVSVTTTTTRTATTGLDPRFRTCALARAHGYGPYVRGRDPEYAWYDDANHNGVVC